MLAVIVTAPLFRRFTEGHLAPGEAALVFLITWTISIVIAFVVWGAKNRD